jgi:hypothetical protein
MNALFWASNLSFTPIIKLGRGYGRGYKSQDIFLI